MSESFLVAGRYRTLRPVGRGGMGIVWLCQDEVLHREVAIKQLGWVGGPDSSRERAMREARLAAGLRHPNAVAVHDVLEWDGRQWLVMEYVPGRSLSQVIADDGPLDPAVAARIGAQVASALCAAHALGIVHRDVKAGNVLVDETWAAKLTDFGIARGRTDPRLTSEGLLSGTPSYLAPELVIGEDPSPASDVWALGVTLFDAVEGEPPYGVDDNLVRLLQRIDAEDPRAPTHAGVLAAPIAAMLQRDPAARCTMPQALAQLDAVLVATRQPPVGLDRLQSGKTMQVMGQPPAPGPRAAAPRPVRPMGAQGEPPAASSTPTPTRVRRRIALVVGAVVLFGAGFGVRAAYDGLSADSDATTASPASSVTTSAGSATAASSAVLTPVEREEAFVRTFFATAPKDQDTAWAMLDAAAQNRGRAAFDQVWASISKVDVLVLNATENLTVSYQIVISPKAGGTETTYASLTLMRAGDSFRIATLDPSLLGPDPDN